MKLFLLRHGQTDWNLQGRIQGQTDIPLNYAGKGMALKAAAALRDIPFDRAYCSSLTRTRETLDPVLKGRGTPVFYRDLLKEISFGEDEGVTFEEIKAHREWSVAGFFFSPASYVPRTGAESVGALRARARAFLDELSLSCRHLNNVLAVTHGAFTHATICEVCNLPDARFWESRKMRNCSVTVVELKDGHWSMEREAVDLLGGENPLAALSPELYGHQGAGMMKTTFP